MGYYQSEVLHCTWHEQGDYAGQVEAVKADGTKTFITKETAEALGFHSADLPENWQSAYENATPAQPTEAEPEAATADTV